MWKNAKKEWEEKNNSQAKNNNQKQSKIENNNQETDTTKKEENQNEQKQEIRKQKEEAKEEAKTSIEKATKENNTTEKEYKEQTKAEKEKKDIKETQEKSKETKKEYKENLKETVQNAEKEESIKEKIAKIKKIKAKKGIRNAGIVIIAIIIIFILVLILDKSQNTFNGQVLKIVGITEQKTEEAKVCEDAISSLKDEIDKINNQYIRLAADFDNYRKRTEAQKTELINMGLENALLKMIEVLDNFDRAKKTMEGITDCEAALKSFDVLYNQVFENLKKLGLEIISTENEKFDPNYHEAVMQTPNNEVEDQTILNELQKGYKLKDKVLRPTLVNVAVNS